MTSKLKIGFVVLVLGLALVVPTFAATNFQVGVSGKTYASATVECRVNSEGDLSPTIEAGLYSPTKKTTADVLLNGVKIATVTVGKSNAGADWLAGAEVWLPEGNNTVTVSIGSRVTDTYAFTVQTGLCGSSGNTSDGILEYAASGKSYMTITPGCAWNGAYAQPYVHLFDNGTYLLNVSVNGVPLTQLSSLKTFTPIFLSSGVNVITAANGTSTDYYVRNGGFGTCTL